VDETALEVVGYSSQRFINGVKDMLKEKRFASRIFSSVLTMTLISSVFVGIPSANAIDPLQVGDSAALIAAGLDPTTTSVKITKDITLTANLVINHTMTITRGDLLTGSPTISGFGVEINSGVVVTMSYLTLTGDNSQSEGNYGVMIQGASTLNASNLTLTRNSDSKDNTGFNVASGSILSLTNS